MTGPGLDRGAGLSDKGRALCALHAVVAAANIALRQPAAAAGRRGIVVGETCT